MIRETQGDLLASDAEAFVNAVNTVGVMGKGIALQFKQAFPENFDAYAACKRGEFAVGQVLTVELSRPGPPRYVINVPTKRHWRDESRMEDVEAGLAALAAEATRLGLRSLALPALGCGLGGLPWPEVRARIHQTFEPLPEIEVALFAPP